MTYEIENIWQCPIASFLGLIHLGKPCLSSSSVACHLSTTKLECIPRQLRAKWQEYLPVVRLGRLSTSAWTRNCSRHRHRLPDGRYRGASWPHAARKLVLGLEKKSAGSLPFFSVWKAGVRSQLSRGWSKQGVFLHTNSVNSGSNKIGKRLLRAVDW